MDSPSNPLKGNPLKAANISPSSFLRPNHPRPTPAAGSAPVGASNAVAQATLVARTTTPAVSVGASPAVGTVSPERQSLDRQRRNGASWFYWVAGLSLINSVVALTGQEWRFIIGLGVTQVADTLAARSGTGWPAAAVVDLMLIAGFVLLGRCAIRGQLWAFLVGIALYAADGLIFLVVRDWVGVGFHAFVVGMTFRGLQAARQLGSSS